MQESMELHDIVIFVILQKHSTKLMVMNYKWCAPLNTLHEESFFTYM